MVISRSVTVGGVLRMVDCPCCVLEFDKDSEHCILSASYYAGPKRSDETILAIVPDEDTCEDYFDDDPKSFRERRMCFAVSQPENQNEVNAAGLSFYIVEEKGTVVVTESRYPGNTYFYFENCGNKDIQFKVIPEMFMPKNPCDVKKRNRTFTLKPFVKKKPNEPLTPLFITPFDRKAADESLLKKYAWDSLSVEERAVALAEKFQKTGIESQLVRPLAEYYSQLSIDETNYAAFLIKYGIDMYVARDVAIYEVSSAMAEDSGAVELAVLKKMAREMKYKGEDVTEYLENWIESLRCEGVID